MISALSGPAAARNETHPQRRSVPQPASPRPYLAAVPDCEPPFDDERSPISRIQQLRRTPAPSLQLSQLPVRDRLTCAGPATATVAAGIPVRVLDSQVPGWSQEPDMGVRRTATAQLPPAARAGSVLARALVEVLSGQRSVAQLRVHCAPDVFAGLQCRTVVPGGLSHLMTVRVCQPADGVAEVCAVVRRGERVSAIAFRVQGVDGRWRVTALQTG